MINHVEQILSRVYGQYQNSPKLKSWLSINGEIGNELQSATDGVAASYDIDASEGKQLDIIGDIVGIGREVIGDIQFPPHEFGDESVEFGDPEAQFSSLDVASNEQLSDEYYRVLIKAKIVKNTSDATLDSIITGIEFILPNGAPITINDDEDMSFTIDIFGSVSPIERQILSSADVVPRPQGVQFSGYRVISDLSETVSEFGDTTAEFGDQTAEYGS